AGTGATNVIPGTLEVTFNFRHAPASSRESLQRRLEAALAQRGRDHGRVWTGWGNPYLTPPGALVGAASEAVREATGVTPEVSRTGGTSDGRLIAAICRRHAE